MWEGAGVVVVASRRGTGMAPTSSSGGGNADILWQNSSEARVNTELNATSIFAQLRAIHGGSGRKQPYSLQP